MIVTRLSRRWDVPDEFWLLWWRNREHRQLIIDVPVEPASKVVLPVPLEPARAPLRMLKYGHQA